MRDKDQILMYNRQQLEIIKHTFAENEELLYSIRKVLLQFPITDEQRGQLKTAMTKDVFTVVKMRLLPSLDGDTPLTQLGDLYQSLNNDLRTKSVLDMASLFQSKKIEMEYLEQQFKQLENVDEKLNPKIILDDLKNITDDFELNYINTTARNFLLSYVDSYLNMVKNLAGQKDETVEEQAKRLERDSNK